MQVAGLPLLRMAAPKRSPYKTPLYMPVMILVPGNGRHIVPLRAVCLTTNEREGKMMTSDRENVQMCIVRSLGMANWLCNNGFKILKVEDSEKDKRFKVFFFKNTPSLQHCMLQYQKKV